MKTGNVILAIFLWLCIPATFFFGGFLGYFTGGIVGVIIGAIILPLMFFLIGLVVLIMGMEKKPKPYRQSLITTPQPIESSSKKQNTFCKECGAKCDPTDKFCENCGEKIE